MKKFLAIILAMTMFSQAAMAECDFSTGITKNPDSTFTYTKECHIKVGETVRDLKIANEQNDKLTKALDLKDLAITKADSRADLWQGATFKLEDRINTIDSMRSTNNWMYFGLGVITVLAAGYAASRVYSH